MKQLIAALALCLAACGGSKSDPKTTTNTAPATAGALELGELEFFEGDEAGLKLHSDGRVEVRMSHSEAGKPPEVMWHEVGVLAADGSITHDGKKEGQLLPDGTFAMPDGKVAEFKLDGDVLLVGDKRVTLDDQGVLQGGNPMPKPARVTGANTSGLRRTALFVLALMLSGKPSSKDMPAAKAGP